MYPWFIRFGTVIPPPPEHSTGLLDHDTCPGLPPGDEEAACAGAPLLREVARIVAARAKRIRREANIRVSVLRMSRPPRHEEAGAAH
jgi:hypothetical protein